MVEVIDFNMYGTYTALEDSLGRTPTSDDVDRFDELATKALTQVISDMGTNECPVCNTKYLSGGKFIITLDGIRSCTNCHLDANRLNIPDR
jgi:hypothetical protein